MKKIIIPFFLLITTFVANAQIEKHAHWSEPELSKKNPEIGETIDLIFNVSVDEHWYIYSSDFDPELGPNVTTFTFEGSEGVEIIGNIKAINPKKQYDDIYEGEYTYFEPKGQFKQTVKITTKNPQIKTKVEFQTCMHDGMCVTDKQKFSFTIAASEPKKEIQKEDVKKVENNSEEKTEVAEVAETKSEEKVEDTNEVVTSEETSENESEEEDKTEENTNKPVKFTSMKNGVAKGIDGNDYVFVKSKWYKVPKDNSASFYKKYLMLGGSHEE